MGLFGKRREPAPPPPIPGNPGRISDYDVPTDYLRAWAAGVLGEAGYPTTAANVETVANSGAGVVLMNGLIGFAKAIPLPAYLTYEDEKAPSPDFIGDFDSDCRTFLSLPR